MALKAGYKGIKNNLLNKLKALPFISSIGSGLSLNDGVLSATGGGGGDTTIIAPEFSDASAYSVGDYVTYSDKLYRFTSAHVVGAWNLEEVTEVTVTGDLKVNTEDIKKSYKTDDATESTIADGDYVPFFDSSAASGAGAPKKSTWSNFKNKILAGVALISAIGNNEDADTAAHAYNQGEHFYKDGKFCTATLNIAIGDTLTLNTNYSASTIADIFGGIDVYHTDSNEYFIGYSDGKPLYRKYFTSSGTDSTAEASKQVKAIVFDKPTNVDESSMVIDVKSVYVRRNNVTVASSTFFLRIPPIAISVDTTQSTFTIFCGQDITGGALYYDVNVWLDYTKTV